MRALSFSKRNLKELLRDPLSLVFGAGFPVLLLVLFNFLSKSVEQMPDIFSIASLAPGMVVFGLSFLSVLLGLLISGDRETAFLSRLFASPMVASDFVLGYVFPGIGLGVIQSAISFAVACLLGFDVSWRLLLCFPVLAVDSLLYISFGVFSGTLFSQKALGAFNTMVINLSAWLSGTWFDLELFGGNFKKVCKLLPFYRAVDAAKAVFSGDAKAVSVDLLIVAVYSAVILSVSTLIFKRKMK